MVATNLPVEEFSSTAVIRLYARRFEIEHDFKDLKNASYGMDMEHVDLEETGTYERLMCIVALSEALLWLAGSEAEAKRLHLDLTPSRPKDGRRVLSLRNVGKMSLTKIQAPIDVLVRKHLGKAIERVPSVVGRRWKDAKTKLYLVSGAAHPDTVPELPTACAKSRKGPRKACRPTKRWHVKLGQLSKAA